ncbi:MAG: hypothetical protein FWH39_01140 [Bacteroidales bacterium]|nr:hypothetical protein [Bacteroidales bacterium]
MSLKNFAQTLPQARLAVINIGSGAVYKVFKKLCPHSDHKIVYLKCRKKEVSSALALCEKEGVFALVLGVAETALPQQSFSAAVITPAIDLSQAYLRQLLCHRSLNYCAALGFQTYLSPAGDIDTLKGRYCESLRLGALREDIASAEPLLRDADYVWFDITTVRASDAPQRKHLTPNGLYAEEACQLLHYIALSNRTKVLFLHNFSTLACLNKITTHLLAQLIWHLAEGLGEKIKEELLNISENVAFKEIMVDMGLSGQELYFLYSETTQRWWIKVPCNKEDMRWIPCNRNDYQVACQGKVPVRWIWHYQKLNY